MNTQPTNNSEKWHDEELVTSLRETLALPEGAIDYAEIESNAEKMDEFVDKFMEFKEKKMLEVGHASYGVFEYKRFSKSNADLIRDADKELSNFITKLEERELVLKTSVSSIPAEVLNTMLHKGNELTENNGVLLNTEKEAHTFAMAFSLDNVKDRLESGNADSVTYTTTQGDILTKPYRDYLIDTFNIKINSDDTNVQNDLILNEIRESLRDTATLLVKRHSGIPATTTNSHVTGVILDDDENVKDSLKIYLVDSLSKLHPDGHYDMNTAGRDMMVSFGYTPQETRLVKLTDNSIVVSYSTSEGNINQVNNAVSYDKVSKSLNKSGALDKMSPFVIVDKVSNLVPDNSATFTVENTAKRTKLAITPLLVEPITDELRMKVQNNLVTEASPVLTVSKIRQLQEYKFGFLSGSEIERIAIERLKGHPIGELISQLEDGTSIGHIEFGIHGLDDSIEADKVSSIMSDISGYSLAGELLKKFDVNAADVFIPLISDIAKFVEKTGGLQDNFAGDSINIIYASDTDMKTLRGAEYKNAAFDTFNPAQKSLYAEIAIHIIKDTYEKKLENVLAENSPEFINLISSIVNKEEDLTSEEKDSLNKIEEMLTNTSNDTELKLAMSYKYVALIARLRGGRLDIKSLSAISDCSIELTGPTSLKDAFDEDKANTNIPHDMGNRETLRTGKFDSERYALEDIARKNAIVMDEESFNKLRAGDSAAVTTIGFSIENLFHVVKDEHTNKSIYVLNLKEALQDKVVLNVLENLGVSLKQESVTSIS